MFKKTLPFFALSAAMVLIGAGCFGSDDLGNNTPPATNTPATSTTTTIPTTSTTSTGQNPTTTTSTPTTTTSTVQKRVFNVSAKQFSFNPRIIQVNRGDAVEIRLTSDDVAHGFSLPAYNINVTASQGNPIDVNFVATEAGTFTFKCSVPCGTGHKDMTGTLIVR